MKTLLLILAGWLTLTSCNRDKHDHTHEAKEPKVYYTCSMDPQVMETKPGKCPICHMELTPITRNQVQKNGLKLSDEQISLAHIVTKKVVYGSVEHHILATGQVKENQNHVRMINARVEGRIETLYVKTNGSTLKKGQPLYRIYSEMLAATQSEYISNWQRLSQHPRDPLLTRIHDNATTKLLLWGLTESQIEELKQLHKPTIPYPILSPISGIVKGIRITEGQTVMEGDVLFELTAYESLWVEAQFYPNETAGLKQGTPVDVEVMGSSAAPVVGHVVQVLPQLAPGSTVSVVRIQISAKGSDFVPGMQAYVSWHKADAKSLVVPTTAILREAKGNTIWVKNKEGLFEPKMVHLGKISASRAEVLHGLQEGEEVVVSGAYLLQSEYIFKKGNNPMAGHDMSKM